MSVMNALPSAATKTSTGFIAAGAQPVAETRYSWRVHLRRLVHRPD